MFTLSKKYYFYPFYPRFYIEATVQIQLVALPKIPNAKFFNCEICSSKNAYIINVNEKEHNGRCFPDNHPEKLFSQKAFDSLFCMLL